MYNKIFEGAGTVEKGGWGVTGFIFLSLLAALHGDTTGVGIWESFMVSENREVH